MTDFYFDVLHGIGIFNILVGLTKIWIWYRMIETFDHGICLNAVKMTA